MKGLFPEADELFDATFDISIDGVTAVTLIGQLQLASRHPANNGPSVKYSIEFAKQLQTLVSEKFPNASAILEMGWDKDYDV